MYPTCGGVSQSPINIIKADYVRAPIEKTQFMKISEIPSEIKIENNGHSGKK